MIRASKLEIQARIVVAEDWVQTVKPKKHPPEDLFASGTAKDIFAWLKQSHGTKAKMSSALSFYMNRAGDSLSPARRSVLNHVRAMIGDMESTPE